MDYCFAVGCASPVCRILPTVCGRSLVRAGMRQAASHFRHFFDDAQHTMANGLNGLYRRRRRSRRRSRCYPCVTTLMMLRAVFLWRLIFIYLTPSRSLTRPSCFPLFGAKKNGAKSRATPGPLPARSRRAGMFLIVYEYIKIKLIN